MTNVYGSGGLHLPMGWLVALATGELRVLVYGLRPVYGALRFAHLLGVGAFFGVLVLMELKRAGLFGDASIQAAKPAIFRVMNWSFGLAVVSGLLLFFYDPIGVGVHTMFVPKLLLIVAGLVHAFWLQRRSVMRGHEPLRRAGGVAALIIWILVIGCSTWNAVERPLNPAAVHRLDPQG